MSILNISDGEARTYSGILENFDVLDSDDKDQETKTYVVSGCWHVPFHNQVLYAGFKKMLRDVNPDGFVLAGDFLDIGALSDYERGKVSRTNVTLEEEYFEGNLVLDEIDYILKDDAEKFYLWGNHCDRYWRWKADVNNSKYGDILNPNRGLRLSERGYTIKDNYQNDFIELASLQVFHGYYHNIHVAKQHLDKLRRNCMFPHTHRTQSYREGSFAAWNIGFMANRDAQCFTYASRAMRESWSNAFAIVHVRGARFYVEMIDVVDDHFVYNGKFY